MFFERSTRIFIIVTFLHQSCNAGAFQSLINQDLKHMTICNQESTDEIDNQEASIQNKIDNDEKTFESTIGINICEATKEQNISTNQDQQIRTFREENQKWLPKMTMKLKLTKSQMTAFSQN